MGRVIDDSFVVGFLGGDKAASVHTIVDVFVDPGINCVHLLLQTFRCQIEFRFFSKVIERIVEHLNDICRFIADYCLELLVPQDGNGVLAVLVHSHLVKVTDVFDSIERLGRAINLVVTKAIGVLDAGLRVGEDPSGVLVNTRSSELPCWMND